MKKIMFNDKYGLTQAVLDSHKTMTRRIIKFGDEIENMPIGGIYDDEYQYAFFSNDNKDISTHAQPAYKVGEVVAIAQSYKKVCYSPSVQETVENKLGMSAEDSAGWNNKMFVRADHMLHHIKITDIKMELLQDISDEECLKEGIRRCNLNKRFTFDFKYAHATAREAFAALIDKVSGKGTWESNPWVFAYEFELID